MDQSNTQQSISDDQELAKVLAGVTGESDAQTETQPATETIVTAPPVEAAPEETSAADESITPQMPDAGLAPITPSVVQPASSNELDTVKQEALQELRPLVDKLNVSPEEKFDTYLLLLRSTDDKELIEPAHEAAKGIADEARRAQALLDIIKEIDFLSQNNVA